MSISKAERQAYEDGLEQRDCISNHPLNYLCTGGSHSCPTDPTLEAAFEKGLEGKQLDK